MNRDAIFTCLRSSLEPLTAVEVAVRIGASREKVQTEMLQMHCAGLLSHKGWRDLDGRRRATFQVKEVK